MDVNPLPSLMAFSLLFHHFTEAAQRRRGAKQRKGKRDETQFQAVFADLCAFAPLRQKGMSLR
jgi:hypothetical protein